MNARTLLALTLVTAGAARAVAQVPTVMNFQGTLANESGRPMDGTYRLDFRIYCSADPAAPTCATDPAATPYDGATPLWTGTLGGTRVIKGLFNVLLGDESPTNPRIPPWVFDGPERYLEVVVEGQVLAPRQRIAAVPYAMRSAGSLVVVKAYQSPQALGVDTNDIGGCGNPLTFTDVAANFVKFGDVRVEIPQGTVTPGPGGEFVFTAPFSGWYRVSAKLAFSDQRFNAAENFKLRVLKAPIASPDSFSQADTIAVHEVEDTPPFAIEIGLSGTTLLHLDTNERLAVVACVNLGGNPRLFALDVPTNYVVIELAHLD